ncbi:leucyl aminopeptidase [uncultured Rothia sp.]|uniref:leucyl aminopeptidase n=1 Tax=uncultured Rothia sp. TaxID=316088 RepID=UPI003217F9EC
MTDSADLTFSVAIPDFDAIDSQVLVLGIYSTNDGPQLAPTPLNQKTTEGLQAILNDIGATGETDQLIRLPGFDGTNADIIALIGLGPQQDKETNLPTTLRYAAGSAIRQLAGFKDVALALPSASVQEVAAIAEGAALGAFVDTQLRAKNISSTKQPVENIVIVTSVDNKDAAPALTRALILGQAVDSTRHLVNTPPSHLYPATFAQKAQERVANHARVSVKIFDEKKLAKEGFGGIIGVGQGSSRPPRLVEVSYTPKKAKKSVALIGKGITFDTGGISLKPSNSMVPMKSDMAGAATVLNVVAAAAELELPIQVTAYLCIAENMPGGSAIRPEDVLTMRDGTTVEVLNTDAEGRLVMADGLAYASESTPDFILDVATLTGAQMIALGNRFSAVMGDSQTREKIVSAAHESGEDFWPMPLPDHMRSELKSPVADLKNIGNSRYGGMLMAGLFLEEFVGSVNEHKIPWAHLDIAGPAFNEGSAYGFTPKEATGVAVSTLVKFLENLV